MAASSRSRAPARLLRAPAEPLSQKPTDMIVMQAAAPATRRSDFALSVQNNLVHGEDSGENAAREIAL